ncbi:hypothetical protein [Sphingobacterium sp. WOUb80]|uniref:hypothetical protein n=1 Tax=Sphingobacterium sp. WOUb80 TaxID=3234028 RepID=UPI003CECCA3E
MVSLNINKVLIVISVLTILTTLGCVSEVRKKPSTFKTLQKVPESGTYFRNSDTSSLFAVIQGMNSIHLYKIDFRDSVYIGKFFGEKSNDSIFMDWRDYQKYPYNSKIGYIGGQPYPMWTIARKNKENPKNDIKGYFLIDEMVNDPLLGQKLERISNETFSRVLLSYLEKTIFNFRKNIMIFDSKNLNGRKYDCNINIDHRDLNYQFDNPYGTINLFYNLTISTNGEIVESGIDHLKNANQKIELIKEVAHNLIGKKAQIYTILNLPVSTCIPCAVTIRFTVPAVK